jgi:hypothetical protein
MDSRFDPHMTRTTLPCFVGDADPPLAGGAGADPHMDGTLRLLTLSETRKTKRVRLFTEEEYGTGTDGDVPLVRRKWVSLQH